jgi:uncharacterized membrane protein YeaQ/YmgE (transglycosylase-associated protein family)
LPVDGIREFVRGAASMPCTGGAVEIRLCSAGEHRRLTEFFGDVRLRFDRERWRAVEARFGSCGKHKELTMSFIAWIVLGLIAGFIASKLVNKTGEGMLMDIVLGVVGAVVGGWLFHTFGMPGVTGLNLYSLVVAVAGAAIFLIVYHALTRRSV